MRGAAARAQSGSVHFFKDLSPNPDVARRAGPCDLDGLSERARSNYVFAREQPLGEGIPTFGRAFWAWWSWEYNVSLVADTFGATVGRGDG